MSNQFSSVDNTPLSAYEAVPPRPKRSVGRLTLQFFFHHGGVPSLNWGHCMCKGRDYGWCFLLAVSAMSQFGEGDDISTRVAVSSDDTNFT